MTFFTSSGYRDTPEVQLIDTRYSRITYEQAGMASTLRYYEPYLTVVRLGKRGYATHEALDAPRLLPAHRPKGNRMNSGNSHTRPFAAG